MSKTSAQIYQDIEAIDATDRDFVVTQQLLKELALGAANTATGLETINAFERGPVISPTAASLYTLVDAIDESDRDGTTLQDLVKMTALLIAKIAQEIESIRTGLGPQLRTQDCAATISLSASEPDTTTEIFLSTSASLAASCERAAMKAAAASVTLTPSSVVALCKELSVGITLSEATDNLSSIILADSATLAASLEPFVIKKLLEANITLAVSYAFFASKALETSVTLAASCTLLTNKLSEASITLAASTSDNVLKKELSASITAAASQVAV